MVRPVVRRPPAEPSPAELAVIKAVRRAKLFVFLRLHRHELFDAAFQAELATMWTARRGSRRCRRPGWPWPRCCKRTPGCAMTR